MLITDGDYDLRSDPHRDLHLELMRLIDAHLNWTQRQLAKALGESLGKADYCVRALKEKGLVKCGQLYPKPQQALPSAYPDPSEEAAHFLQHNKINNRTTTVPILGVDLTSMIIHSRGLGTK